LQDIPPSHSLAHSSCSPSVAFPHLAPAPCLALQLAPLPFARLPQLRCPAGCGWFVTPHTPAPYPLPYAAAGPCSSGCRCRLIAPLSWTPPANRFPCLGLGCLMPFGLDPALPPAFAWQRFLPSQRPSQPLVNLTQRSNLAPLAQQRAYSYTPRPSTPRFAPAAPALATTA